MDRFYFERPSLERKEAIIEYFNEFVEHHSQIHGAGSLDRFLKGYTFEEALERCLRMEDKEYASQFGWCVGKTLLMIRESDDKIIGILNIRWDLNEAMLRFAGHIGYSIRPTERRKGYNKINLYHGLKEAKQIGLDRVMVSCNVSNIGSEKSILALGGVLERCGLDEGDDEETKVFWINVDESLEKYKDLYEDSIV